MSAAELTELQAAEIVASLQGAQIRFWIIGGWGIDALVREQTRPHHDLDLLVVVADLPQLDVWLRASGFTRAYEWEENANATIDGTDWDTAFVAVHADGRELDIHAIRSDGVHGELVTDDPWELPADWAGFGRIAGQQVPCATANAQRAMHEGYELPETHRSDLRRIHHL